MITSVTHDIGAALRKEDDVYKHVGKMTSRMAGVDECAATILARAVSLEAPALARSIFQDVFFGTKMQYLKKALPDEWIWKKLLLKWMQDTESYRNALAHSSVHTAFGINAPTARTLVMKKGAMLEVDPSVFEMWEARAEILYVVLVEVSRTPDDAFLQNDLRELGRHLASGRQAQLAAVDDMFPEP
jgi:hypothetical protein